MACRASTERGDRCRRGDFPAGPWRWIAVVAFFRLGVCVIGAGDRRRECGAVAHCQESGDSVKFFLPSGGVVDEQFGIMTTPAHKGIPIGIKAGLEWCADNQCYTQGFDPPAFFAWLDSMRPYHSKCLFVPVPDVVGDAGATLDKFWRWHKHFGGWPIAFVAQDGQELLSFPDNRLWSVLFIGGTTEWKLSAACERVIANGQSIGKHIHIGRVNWWERYEHFRSLPGSDDFTCDGTRQRFDGIENTMAAWIDYMERTYQQRMLLV
jgi:hypothetical protein